MATNPLHRTKKRSKPEVDWSEFVQSLLLIFIGGWFFMITVGVVHHEWLPAMPTLGYWPSLLIFFMLDWVVTLSRWHARTVPVGTNSKQLIPNRN